ncbi:alpha/beta fold hydrolase [Chelatococcus reniformis]|uniref:Hydrolase n=1 Tax=Chelatococcus reniformis TaxID=1494448 RepID=A0A916TXW6_9HYPH|nr:alpha/beta hydrolase [Chelatococcus reniformis]GGC48373.1 hydrolase [Chelatococcus reniformis]
MLFTHTLPERTEIGGSPVEYLRVGEGPTLLYLHGFDGVSVDDPFIGALAKHFDVVAPSLPGFGASARPRSMRTMEDLAHFTVSLVRTLGLDDVTLVGSSFGGWVAAEMAAKGCDGLSRLALADPVGARFTTDPAEKEILDVFITETKHYPGLLFSDPEKANLAFSNMDFANMDEDASLRFCANREGLTQFGWAPLLHNPGLRARLAYIDIPTLVLWGADDRIVPVSYGRRFAEAIPGATFEVVAEAGHYLPLEQPLKFAEHLVKFRQTAHVN